SEAAIKGKVRIFSQIPGGNSSAVSYFSSLSSRTNGNSCTTEESCAAILFALLGSLTTPSGNGGGSNIRDITSHADNHLTPHQLLPKAVPEPSATVGIIAVSAIGWLIRRKRVLTKSV
ncbi:MAG: PEP-CTERM sorting domain-containing protein, partial [Phormidesmis sp. CAN_BIN36]|nr:PEP-CTERM sorting domain-containing protein [Phormidesmis sp. CAN_BIN36]